MEKTIKLIEDIIDIEKLFESIPIAMTLISREGRIITLNQNMADLEGFDINFNKGKKISEFNKEAGENVTRDFRFFDQGRDVPAHELIIKGRFYLVSNKPIRDSDGLAVAEMVSLTDITEVKMVEKKLEEANKKLQDLAKRDPLTGLFNAGAYSNICNQMMEVAHRENTMFSVLFMDLDHFKKINDNYGHSIGDTVLKSVAQCLLKTFRKSDVIARVGGEEFVVYLPNTAQQGALTLAEKLRVRVEKLSLYIDEIIIKVTVSIGIATRMQHHKTITDIQKDADCAMYQAKKDGRNRVTTI